MDRKKLLDAVAEAMLQTANSVRSMDRDACVNSHISTVVSVELGTVTLVIRELHGYERKEVFMLPE